MKRKLSDDEEEAASNVVDPKDETQSEDDTAEKDARLYPADSLPEQQECIQQQQQQQLAAFLSVLSQATPSAKLPYPHPTPGPSIISMLSTHSPPHYLCTFTEYSPEFTSRIILRIISKNDGSIA